MVIATFNSATGWVGKTITFDNDVFTLEGHGPVSPASVLTYDRSGQLDWAYEGLPEWVATRAVASAASATAPGGPKGFEWHSWTGSPGSQATGLRTPWGMLTLLTIIGLVVVIVGLIVVVGAMGTDVSVPTDYGDRVNNIGLMNDQRNGIIGGIVVAVIGGVILVIAYSRGELDDWLKRGSAARGHKFGADRQRGSAMTGESQAATSTPFSIAPPSVGPYAATQTANVVPAALTAQPSPATAVLTPYAEQPAPIQPLAPAPAAAGSPVSAPVTGIAEEIAKLADLHAKGVLTDAEFAAYKAKLVG